MNSLRVNKYLFNTELLIALSLLFPVCAGPQTGTPQGASDDYPLGPDSLPQPSAPAGKTFQFEMANSKVFPGTHRTITVYVPAAYRADKPACVYVGLDDLGFKAPVVFDNLIAQHAMPVTIGIGVSSGIVDSRSPSENPRFDRSFEFDSLSDRLPRFLLEDVFPAVERHTTPDGKRILLSKNPNDRAIGGASTGGIGAFTVAWQRPDEFRRVFTAIGTFVGMRGGEQYYVLVRKTEPKPLRIFMQDGAYDEWGGGPEMGDWWMSNQTMERALEFAGYDVRHVWGTGTHDDSHAASVFPDAMRWLWHNWPVPVASAPPGNPVLKAILREGSEWETVTNGCSDSVPLVAGPTGELYTAVAGVGELTANAAGKSRQPCAASAAAQVVAFDAKGVPHSGTAEEQVLGNGMRVCAMTVRANGDLYATTEKNDGTGELWLISADGRKVKLDTGLRGASGLAFSPDGLWLMVAQRRSRWAYSYRVGSDGLVDAREPFYSVATAGSMDDSEAGAIWMDIDGRPYVATALGVQVFDRNGRVTAILPLPNGAAVSGLSFAGDDWKTIYAAGGGVIYRRKLKAAGAPPWAPAIKLPKWGAG